MVDVFVYSVTAGLFLIFLLSYIHDRRKIINGFLFNMFLCSAYIALMFAVIQSNNQILLTLFVILSGILFVGFILSIFILTIVALLSAKKLIQREGFRISNLLTLFVGVGGLLMIVFTFFLYDKVPNWVLYLSHIATLFIAYFVFVFINFYMSCIVYQIARPRLNKDFIIVLGSGLIDGHKVGPLLANRIQKAVDFYQRQAKKRTPPRIIFSGGKGDDEHLSEAEAMKQYALNVGIPEANTLIEDKSVNTFENMKFSKELMQSIGSTKPKVIFATSNYHVFRSSIYAKKAKLDAQGIGARTPFYFWSNAMLREYIAIVVMHKKIHIVVLVLIVLSYILLSIALYMKVMFPI